ncbi:MAG: DUF3006 domain-containing protein [Clostridia bacterium]|nr:DUF3006 domain-containing protein [Clostridia bacterium]
MRYIIDRFEGPFAVCEAEDGIIVRIVRSTLPSGCVEGSVIAIGEDGYWHLLDNSGQRQRLWQRISALFRTPKKD